MIFFAPTDQAYREDVVSPAPKEPEAMAELNVLLPEYQAQALEEAAHKDGLTAAQFLRRLISQALRCSISQQS
jgi:hypothetical protein